MKRKSIFIPLAVVAFALAGCATYPPEPAPYGPVYAGGGYSMVATATKPPFGTFLVGPDGRSLYILEGTRGTAGDRCSGECLGVWPPLHASEPPRAGPGVDPAALSTVMAHGAPHATYAGWPLYYYHRDRAPGDTTGQHVVDRWGTWHLISPSGAPIRPAGRY
jgi:predicted lipoprotein with Yx(FWY)xxD motif